MLLGLTPCVTVSLVYSVRGVLVAVNDYMVLVTDTVTNIIATKIPPPFKDHTSIVTTRRFQHGQKVW